jgi:hypothetical protein
MLMVFLGRLLEVGILLVILPFYFLLWPVELGLKLFYKNFWGRIFNIFIFAGGQFL